MQPSERLMEYVFINAMVALLSYWPASLVQNSKSTDGYTYSIKRPRSNLNLSNQGIHHKHRLYPPANQSMQQTSRIPSFLLSCV